MKKNIKAYLLSGLFIAASVISYVYAQQKVWTMTGNGARRNTVEFEIQTQTVGTAADLVPGTDNTNSLGTSSLAWDDIQTEDLTVQDDLTVTDDVAISGLLTVTETTSLSSATVTNRILLGETANTISTFTVTAIDLDDGLDLTVNGLLGVQGDSDPNTNITPTAVGQIVFDTNGLYLCISTAAAANSWVISYSTGTACAG